MFLLISLELLLSTCNNVTCHFREIFEVTHANPASHGMTTGALWRKSVALLKRGGKLLFHPGPTETCYCYWHTAMDFLHRSDLVLTTPSICLCTADLASHMHLSFLNILTTVSHLRAVQLNPAAQAWDLWLELEHLEFLRHTLNPLVGWTKQGEKKPQKRLRKRQFRNVLVSGLGVPLLISFRLHTDLNRDKTWSNCLPLRIPVVKLVMSLCVDLYLVSSSTFVHFSPFGPGFFGKYLVCLGNAVLFHLTSVREHVMQHLSDTQWCVAWKLVS